MPTRTEDVATYIDERISEDENGCWNWRLALNTGGYGLCFRRDWRGLAHRFTYTHLVGTIPDGMQLDHLCRKRACVNPDHLEPVTAATNVQRGVRAVNARNYAVFYEKRGMWCTSATQTVEGRRTRKSFRSKSRETAVAKIEGWLSATR